jgi:putative phosphoesterase
MKRLVIVSDSHGNVKGLEKLLPLIEENHYFVFLGDGIADLGKVLEQADKKTVFCRGNCDFFARVDEDGGLEVENIKIFYCHGHKYGVKLGLNKLARVTKEKGCQIALYGHTHNAKITEMDGVTLINPGSLRLPIGEGGSYCYLVVNGDKFTPVIVGESVM